MKIAVLGGNGQLGQDVVAAFRAEGNEVASLSHQDIEISSADSVKQALENIRPEVVVNTAAFHHVDKCEADPATAFSVNGIGARNVAQVADQLGAKLVHISTDYVFDGMKRTPYVEQDSALPLNVYGNSKLSGECFVRTVNPRHFVVRVSAIYGTNPCRAKGGLNFVELMLKLSKEREELRVVDDEFVSPTPTAQIARQVAALSKTEDYGLYHATTEGSCSWYEFAAAIFELTGTKIRLERARPGEFPAKVPRPKYSVLENAALKSRSLNLLTHWREGLESYLAARAQTRMMSHV
ncbi:MAG: dTDP-4-dehydrorhamnose reductase [Candidatus Angelobacter sp. Gp1-AA117]|nr:MAG: dTDP-4-dehydrorhamnose reductase [Candidatus Angelobacter sp. Gp1-AA117]